MITLAQFVIAMSMLLLGVLIDSIADLSVLWIFAGDIVVSSNRMMYQGAFSGIIKASVDDDNILTTVARAHTIHLLSTAAGMAGISTIILSFCTEVISLTVAHGFMGFFVWSCRVVIGGRVIEACQKENIGRTKVYMEVLFSVSAMIICLSPTIITFKETALYFQYWGFFIVFFAALLWAWKIHIGNIRRATD